MDLRAVPWTVVLRRAVAGANANVQFGRFDIPIVNLFASFRILVTAFVAGSVTARLRFGFLNADADAATLGIDFAAVGELIASDFRSVVYVVGAVAPNVVGNPNSILPPRVSVFIDSPGGSDLTFEISYASLQASG